MLICMKPLVNHLEHVHQKISSAVAGSGLTFSDIAKLSDVDATQVGRICKGQFKTFSHNVVRICDVLGVELPRLEKPPASSEAKLAKAQASLSRLWDNTPEGAAVIERLLDAVADLQRVDRR